MKCLSRWLVGVGLAFLLAGCGSAHHFVEFSSAEDVRANTGVLDDADRQRTEFKGPLFYLPFESSPRKQVSLFLQGYCGRDGAMSYRFVVHFYFEGEWRSFDRAVDGEGKALAVKPLERGVSTCTPQLCARTEDVEVAVSRAYLDGHAGSGVELVVSSGSGQAVERIPVPGSYIRGFLEAGDGK